MHLGACMRVALLALRGEQTRPRAVQVHSPQQSTPACRAGPPLLPGTPAHHSSEREAVVCMRQALHVAGSQAKWAEHADKTCWAERSDQAC